MIITKISRKKKDADLYENTRNLKMAEAKPQLARALLNVKLETSHQKKHSGVVIINTAWY